MGSTNSFQASDALEALGADQHQITGEPPESSRGEWLARVAQANHVPNSDLAGDCHACCAYIRWEYGLSVAMPVLLTLVDGSLPAVSAVEGIPMPVVRCQPDPAPSGIQGPYEPFVPVGCKANFATRPALLKAERGLL
jgi:hypothetical protein